MVCAIFTRLTHFCNTFFEFFSSYFQLFQTQKNAIAWACCMCKKRIALEHSRAMIDFTNDHSIRLGDMVGARCA
jgi:hypothetical protein